VAVAGTGLGALPLAAGGLWLNPETAMPLLGGADAALLAVLAATAAGALAARLPMMARNRHTAAQAAAERNFFRCGR
jgi:hypothetical protein